MHTLHLTATESASRAKLAKRLLAFAAVALVLIAGVVLSATAGDGLARMQMDRLKETHDAVVALQPDLRPVEPVTDYTDYRAILHSHSHWSHDSRGQIEEILAAANKAGVKVICFSEHPASHYDYFRDGHRGLKDGVLLVPGAESGGFLAWPTRSIQDEKTDTPQAFADLVRRDDGLIFLCHLEERMDWDIAGLTGSEIYNTHADVKEDKRLMSSLVSPLTLLSLIPALREYPQETFAAIQDYPADYLKRYDELCQKTRLTGVAANDAHHNQGVKGIIQENGKLLIEDLLGKKIVELDPQKVAFLKPLVKDKKAGDVALEIDLDPYERSFHYVSTHLFMREQTQEAVWEALKAGRAYVGFDWIADPSGFAFYAEKDGRRELMGAEIVDSAGWTLKAVSPLPGFFKLIKDGQVIKEDRAREFEYAITEPGNYRFEVFQNLAGELRPWILTNPIYVRPAATEAAAK